MENAVKTLEFLDEFDYLGYYFNGYMMTVTNSMIVEDKNPGTVPNTLRIVDTFFPNVVQLSIRGLDYSYASGAGLHKIPYYR